MAFRNIHRKPTTGSRKSVGETYSELGVPVGQMGGYIDKTFPEAHGQSLDGVHATVTGVHPLMPSVSPNYHSPKLFLLSSYGAQFSILYGMKEK